VLSLPFVGVGVVGVVGCGAELLWLLVKGGGRGCRSCLLFVDGDGPSSPPLVGGGEGPSLHAGDG
jgi:hypothetical protein